jgi:hypothetical protein
VIKRASHPTRRQTSGLTSKLRIAEIGATFDAIGRTFFATGIPSLWLPLRHKQKKADRQEAVLRIVTSPTDWVLADGRTGTGICEFNDLMVDEKPVGLED